MNAIDVAYTIEGDGPPLYKVHGIGSRRATWTGLVLTGELDGGCNPRPNRFIADTLPDSELVILDGLKHSILIEAPERVAPPVRGFLLRHR